MLKQSAKQAARREQFKKIGNALNAIRDANRNYHTGTTVPHPWRILPSAGFSVMQLDTRPGLARKLENPDTDQ